MQRKIFNLINSPPLRTIGMKCYVGGKNLAEAAEIFNGLKRAGIIPMVDILGEKVKTKKEAYKASQAYIECMVHAREMGIERFSLKLSHIGLEIEKEGYEITKELAADILKVSKRLGVMVEMDAEDCSILEQSYLLACALKRSGIGGFSRVAVPANQGCLCRTRLDGRRCTTPGIKFCIDRYLIEFRNLGIGIRAVKGAYYPADIDDSLINRRFIDIVRSNWFSAGATHDLDLLLDCFPYIDEIQMLFGIRMNLQMKLARLLREGKILEWYLKESMKRKKFLGVSSLSIRMPKNIVTYVPIGTVEDAAKYLERRYREGMRPGIFFLFFRNVPESLLWRIRNAWSSFFF